MTDRSDAPPPTHPPEVHAELARVRELCVREHGYDPSTLPAPPPDPPVEVLLAALREIAERQPDLRFGQMIGLLTDRVEVQGWRPAVVDVDDGYLIQAAKEYIKFLDDAGATEKRQAQPHRAAA